MRNFRRRTTRFFSILLLIGGLGCSPSEFTPPPDMDGLHQRIHGYRRDYERGLAMIVSGEPVLGKNLLAATTKRLGVAAEECARTPDCDMQLFAHTLSLLIKQRELAARGLGAGESPTVKASSPLVSAIPELGRTLEFLHGDLEQRIRSNKEVKAALNHWLTWNRPELMDAWQNYQFLRERVAPIYAEAGLPEALLFAMMAKETGAKVHAYSRAGAAGPLQFMPKTARRYGLGSVDGFDMRLDPEASTKASAEYINDQFGALNNDLEKALAAYNGGESRVRRLHRQYKGAGFWDPRIYGALPSETRKYVPQILAAAWLFLNPQEYGLEFPSFENELTEITLLEPISLGELTICLGQASNSDGWFRTLRNLNPRQRSSDRIEAGQTVELPVSLVDVYAERCVGPSLLLRRARELHDADYPSSAEEIAEAG